jgi:hypothetical protein
VALKPLAVTTVTELSDKMLWREAIKSKAYTWLDLYVWKKPDNWMVKVRRVERAIHSCEISLFYSSLSAQVVSQYSNTRQGQQRPGQCA